MNTSHKILRILGIACCLLLCFQTVTAQQSGKLAVTTQETGKLSAADKQMGYAIADSMAFADSLLATDSLKLASDTLHKRHKRNWATWKPNPQRALWLALVIPGAGQIYNRKYWKLPIFYGGFVGCAYALRWNNMMYRDYSQAYLDIMDDDPNTQSYNQFLHLGTRITSENESRWQEVFRKRKDRYRRWRDMSFFAMIAVYGLSVIDAYVDASLSEFDISSDLSLKVSPAVINGGGSNASLTAFRSAGIGLNCCIQF